MDKTNESYYQLDRREILRHVPTSAKKVLEIGCGYGAFGGILKSERDVEVWGIEICEAAAEAASRKMDRIIVANIEQENLSLPLNYFDCLIFNDILEHLINPWRVLHSLRANLVDAGHVVASIPNIRYYHTMKALLLRKEWRYTNAGILDKTHLRFFTEKSVRDMFQSCDYDMVHIEGINSLRYTPRLKVLNWITGCKFEDMRYLQFVYVGQKRGNC